MKGSIVATHFTPIFLFVRIKSKLPPSTQEPYVVMPQEEHCICDEVL